MVTMRVASALAVLFFVEGAAAKNHLMNCPSSGTQTNAKKFFVFRTDPGRWYASHCASQLEHHADACTIGADDEADTNKRFIKFPHIYTSDALAKAGGPGQNLLNWHTPSTTDKVPSNGVVLKFGVTGIPVRLDGSCETWEKEDACANVNRGKFDSTSGAKLKWAYKSAAKCCFGRRYAWRIGDSHLDELDQTGADYKNDKKLAGTGSWTLIAYTPEFEVKGSGNAITEPGYQSCTYGGTGDAEPDCCTFGVRVEDREDPGLRYRPFGPDQKMTRCKQHSKDVSNLCYRVLHKSSLSSDWRFAKIEDCGSCQIELPTSFGTTGERFCQSIVTCNINDQYQTASADQILSGGTLDLAKVTDMCLGGSCLQASQKQGCPKVKKVQPTCRNLGKCLHNSYEHAPPGTCETRQWDATAKVFTCLKYNPGKFYKTDGCADSFVTTDRVCKCTTSAPCTSNQNPKTGTGCAKVEDATTTRDARYTCNAKHYGSWKDAKGARGLAGTGSSPWSDSARCTWSCQVCSRCGGGQYEDAPCLYGNAGPEAMFAGSRNGANSDHDTKKMHELYTMVSKKPVAGGSGLPYCGDAMVLPEPRDYSEVKGRTVENPTENEFERVWLDESKPGQVVSRLGVNTGKARMIAGSDAKISTTSNACRVHPTTGFVQCFYGCEEDTRCLTIAPCNCDEYQKAPPTKTSQRICLKLAAVEDPCPGGTCTGKFPADKRASGSKTMYIQVTSEACFHRAQAPATTPLCNGRNCGISCPNGADKLVAFSKPNTLKVTAGAVVTEHFCQYFVEDEIPITDVCGAETGDKNTAATAIDFAAQADQVVKSTTPRRVFAGDRAFKDVSVCDKATHMAAVGQTWRPGASTDTVCKQLDVCATTRMCDPKIAERNLLVGTCGVNYVTAGSTKADEDDALVKCAPSTTQNACEKVVTASNSGTPQALGTCANTAGANRDACTCPGGAAGSGSNTPGSNTLCTAGQTCTAGAAGAANADGAAGACSTDSKAQACTWTPAVITDDKTQLGVLGVTTEAHWKASTLGIYAKRWAALSPAQQTAAKQLGYTAATWDTPDGQGGFSVNHDGTHGRSKQAEGICEDGLPSWQHKQPDAAKEVSVYVGRSCTPVSVWGSDRTCKCTTRCGAGTDPAKTVGKTATADATCVCKTDHFSAWVKTASRTADSLTSCHKGHTCTKCKACGTDEYETTACTATTDRVCKARTTAKCDCNIEYQTKEVLAKDEDRVCKPKTVCDKTTQFWEPAGTPDTLFDELAKLVGVQVDGKAVTGAAVKAAYDQLGATTGNWVAATATPWDKKWAALTPTQQTGAGTVGYTQAKWDAVPRDDTGIAGRGDKRTNCGAHATEDSPACTIPTGLDAAGLAAFCASKAGAGCAKSCAGDSQTVHKCRGHCYTDRYCKPRAVCGPLKYIKTPAVVDTFFQSYATTKNAAGKDVPLVMYRTKGECANLDFCPCTKFSASLYRSIGGSNKWCGETSAPAKVDKGTCASSGFASMTPDAKREFCAAGIAAAFKIGEGDPECAKACEALYTVDECQTKCDLDHTCQYTAHRPSTKPYGACLLYSNTKKEKGVTGPGCGVLSTKLEQGAPRNVQANDAGVLTEATGATLWAKSEHVAHASSVAKYNGDATVKNRCYPMTACRSLEYESLYPTFIELDVEYYHDRPKEWPLFTQEVVHKKVFHGNGGTEVLPRMYTGNRRCSGFADNVGFGHSATTCADLAKKSFHNAETVKCQLDDVILETASNSFTATIADPLSWPFLTKALPNLQHERDHAEYQITDTNAGYSVVETKTLNAKDNFWGAKRWDGTAGTKDTVYTTVSYEKTQDANGNGCVNSPADWTDDAMHGCDYYEKTATYCFGTDEATVGNQNINSQDRFSSAGGSTLAAFAGVAKEDAISAPDRSARVACCACGGGLNVKVSVGATFDIPIMADGSQLADTEVSKKYVNGKKLAQKRSGIATRLVASTFAGHVLKTASARCTKKKNGEVDMKDPSCATTDDHMKSAFADANHPYPGNHYSVEPYTAPDTFDRLGESNCYEAQKVDSCYFDVYVVDTQAPTMSCIKAANICTTEVPHKCVEKAGTSQVLDKAACKAVGDTAVAANKDFTKTDCEAVKTADNLGHTACKYVLPTPSATAIVDLVKLFDVSSSDNVDGNGPYKRGQGMAPTAVSYQQPDYTLLLPTTKHLSKYARKATVSTEWKFKDDHPDNNNRATCALVDVACKTTNCNKDATACKEIDEKAVATCADQGSGATSGAACDSRAATMDGCINLAGGKDATNGCLFTAAVVISQAACEIATIATKSAAADNQVKACLYQPKILSKKKSENAFSAAIGRHVFNFQSTDTYGNVKMCESELIVRDCFAPVITGCNNGRILPDVKIDALSDQCYGQQAGLTASATDNSNIKPLVQMTVASKDGKDKMPVDDNYKFPIGTTVVTVTATDQSGALDDNDKPRFSTCTRNVIVTDKQVPSLTCTGAISTAVQASLSTSKVPLLDAAFLKLAAVTDNACVPPAPLTFYTTKNGVKTKMTPGVVEFTANGVSKSVTLEAKDCAGNIAKCDFTSAMAGKWSKTWKFESLSKQACACKNCKVDRQNYCFAKTTGKITLPQQVNGLAVLDANVNTGYSSSWTPAKATVGTNLGSYQGDSQIYDCDEIGVLPYPSSRFGAPAPVNMNGVMNSATNGDSFFSIEDPDGTIAITTARISVPPVEGSCTLAGGNIVGVTSASCVLITDKINCVAKMDTDAGGIKPACKWTASSAKTYVSLKYAAQHAKVFLNADITLVDGRVVKNYPLMTDTITVGTKAFIEFKHEVGTETTRDICSEKAGTSDPADKLACGFIVDKTQCEAQLTAAQLPIGTKACKFGPDAVDARPIGAATCVEAAAVSVPDDKLACSLLLAANKAANGNDCKIKKTAANKNMCTYTPAATAWATATFNFGIVSEHQHAAAAFDTLAVGIKGCMDSEAVKVDANAVVHMDSSCDMTQCCSDHTASNYDVKCSKKRSDATTCTNTKSDEGSRLALLQAEMEILDVKSKTLASIATTIHTTLSTRATSRAAFAFECKLTGSCKCEVSSEPSGAKWWSASDPCKTCAAGFASADGKKCVQCADGVSVHKACIEADACPAGQDSSTGSCAACAAGKASEGLNTKCHGCPLGSEPTADKTACKSKACPVGKVMRNGVCITPTIAPTGLPTTTAPTPKPTNAPTECIDNDAAFAAKYVATLSVNTCAAAKAEGFCDQALYTADATSMCPISCTLGCGTPSPTATPTQPTSAPTGNPTAAPSPAPTAVPTASPTPGPTNAPNTDPTSAPTAAPTATPTSAPTAAPTDPTIAPTAKPTKPGETPKPTAPTGAPTISPTTKKPTGTPTTVPTSSPTTKTPTSVPTGSPTTPKPTGVPTGKPTNVAAGMASTAVDVKLDIDGAFVRKDDLMKVLELKTGQKVDPATVKVTHILNTKAKFEGKADDWTCTDAQCEPLKSIGKSVLTATQLKTVKCCVKRSIFVSAVESVTQGVVTIKSVKSESTRRQLRADAVVIDVEVINEMKKGEEEMKKSTPVAFASDIGKAFKAQPLPPAYSMSGEKPTIGPVTVAEMKEKSVVEFVVPLKESSTDKLQTSADSVLKNLDGDGFTAELEKQNPTLYKGVTTKSTASQQAMNTRAPTLAPGGGRGMDRDSGTETGMSTAVLVIIIAAAIIVLLLGYFFCCSTGGSADAARSKIGIAKEGNKSEME